LAKPIFWVFLNEPLYNSEFMMTKDKNSTNPIIRKANIADIDKIEQTMKASMQLLGQGYYSEEQVQSSCKYVCVPDKRIIEDGTYYVVEDENGIMIGCGGWSFRNTLYAGPEVQFKQDNILDPKKDKARVRAMFVLPSLSGRGVGSLILNTAEQEAKKWGFSRGTLGATQSGLAFYKAKGWIVVKEEIATLPDGVKIEVTQMEKDLMNL
jgi:GNAT superfamily N-acetyltransferase